MFIIASPVCWARAKVRALSVSASSWLCSAITPAPQQLARSSVDQLDPELLGDQRHRAVQLGGEAARDAAGPVGDLHVLAHLWPPRGAVSAAALDGLLVGLGLDVLLALDVEVEFLAVLLGVRVDRLDLVLGAVGELVVDARDQLRQRAHLAGPDPRIAVGIEPSIPLIAPFGRLQLALDPGGEGLLEQQRLVERALLLDDLDEGELVVVAVVGVLDPLLRRPCGAGA